MALDPAEVASWARTLHSLYPGSRRSPALALPCPWAVLIKDILFAVPAYVGFAMSGEMGYAWAGLPGSVRTVCLLLIGLVSVQVLNPNGPGLVATLIGLKVWLFYMPMILLGRAYVRDRASLVRLSRLMICLIWLPCGVGTFQWLLSLAIGYQRAITLFYGAAAAGATQGFAQFNNGLMRIPSTFSFPSQYLDYILCMYVPVLGCISIDEDRVWQKLRRSSLLLLCVGGFLSGTRAAFLLIPLMIGIFYLRRSAFNLLGAAVLIAGTLTLAMAISKIDYGGLLDMESTLSKNYANSQTEALGDALQLTLVGRGVGMNTGPVIARDRPEDIAFESYYAKAVAELGLAGLVAVILFQGCLLVWAVRMHVARASMTVTYADAIAACFLVFLIYNYKGFVIDWDPANMLYWLFAGVLFSLPIVDLDQSRRAEAAGINAAFAVS